MIPQNFFFIRIMGRFVRVSYADILYVEACKNYTKIVTVDKMHMALTTVQNVETALPETQFCRLHRSYIVPIDKITSFDQHKVYMAGREFPIGNSYRDALRRKVTLLDSSYSEPSALRKKQYS
ncbi:MAG TPA: LytTR family DNA-binding domain-containing protein [Puia sp.]|nr:LytTR family DNA-binding domain-containing protein [Puia sp.]